MKYELNKLDDKFKNTKYFNLDKRDKSIVKDFTVKEFLELMISDGVNEIADHSYSSEEIIKKVAENFSHELIVTTMNNIQYAYIAYKYNYLSADMFTFEKDEEWYPVVKFALMLNYVFNPFNFEEILAGFEKKFPHLDFHIDINSHLWDSTDNKMKGFQKIYNFSDVVLEQVKKQAQFKELKHENKWNVEEEDESDNDSFNLNLSSIQTNNEILNFIKNIDFFINERNDSDFDWWRSSHFQEEAISVFSEEIHKRNLSSAISWNVNLLSSSMFNKSNFSLYHARTLNDLRFSLFLGESLKDNEDLYSKYFNYINSEIKKDIVSLNFQSFSNGYAYSLEERVLTVLDFIQAWEEDRLVNKLDTIFDGIKKYEEKMISLNRKKSQLSSINEDNIVAKIKEVSENVQNVQLKAAVSSLLKNFETKDLESFNGKVNINVKKSLIVEIDLDNISVYQNEKFNNKLKKSEVNGYLSKMWKVVSNSLYPKQTIFPSEIKENNFVFVNYEHPDIKMSDEELRQWTEKVVEYMVNKDLKEKHSIEVIEAELEKVLMQHSLLFSDKTQSKPKTVKF